MTVAVAQVSKRFCTKQAVADLSFEAKGGEVFGLLSPNGVGKTTTLRMVLAIFKPDIGTIRLFVRPFSEASNSESCDAPQPLACSGRTICCHSTRSAGGACSAWGRAPISDVGGWR
jgi:ABC-type transporter Mla maintaining outer membrane lipid asymmetry ATPase subunit MlaF